MTKRNRGSREKLNSSVSTANMMWLLEQCQTRGISASQVLDEALILLSTGFLYQPDLSKVSRVHEVNPKELPAQEPETDVWTE